VANNLIPGWTAQEFGTISDFGSRINRSSLENRATEYRNNAMIPENAVFPWAAIHSGFAKDASGLGS
jgi:hypothetical protein